MYRQYFGLEDKPFSIAPNPDYLFMSDRHREALNHLIYGLGDTGGFVLLTGEVGTGKTTISRRLMENLPENTQAAFILNPTLSSQELLATICDELKIRYRKTGATLKTLTDKIQQKLLKNHKDNINTLLIIDEAQHLAPEVLEQLRLLTNLETNTKKLLQVILIGQPELQQLLQRRDLRQLAQRITARYHLLPLNKQEVAQYLSHRLSVAKCFRDIFDKGAISAIHKICKGIPRLINLLAERSLINAYNANSAIVSKKIVYQAVVDALGDEYQVIPWWQKLRYSHSLILVLFIIIITVGIWFGSYYQKYLSIQKNTDQVMVAAPQHLKPPPTKALSKPTLTDEQMDNEDKLLNQTQKQKMNISAAIDEKKNIATKQDMFRVAEPQETTPQPQTEISPKTSVKENVRVLGYNAEQYKRQLANTEQQQGDDYQVKASEGVSDELLESFQSAINETKDTSNTQVVDQPTSHTDLKSITQMPIWVQDGLPSLQFEMHIYSSDGKGWVKVNGRERYEGDYIARELILNEILPQHIVLSFRGEKFTMVALSSWN